VEDVERRYEMERWLLVAESNCSDPSREDEFNRWYDGVHVPDALETEGFISAARYKTDSPEEGRGKFLALYEIETDDIEQTTTAMVTNLVGKAEQGRISEVYEALSAVFYRRITGPVHRR
jgi:hypothetical protein